MSNTSKNDKAAQLTTCENGITNNFAATDSWVFLGTTYKRGDILSMLQACIQASQKTKADHDTWRASVTEERAQYAAARPVLAAFKKMVESEYGATSQKMAEFGWAPAKVPVKSAQSKAAAAAKASKTKAAKKAALAAVKAGAAAPPAPSPAAPAAPAPAAPAAVPPKGS
jgi:hypothetical protein